MRAKAAKASAPGQAATVTVIDEGLASERVFAFFKEQFESGALKPGDRLLPERELAQHLGVSRPTLREVMRALTLLGVIEIRPGQNAVVATPSAGILEDFFGILLAMRPSIQSNVLEARIAIECQAVRLACTNARASDIERLELALERILETAADDRAGAEADFSFHTAIVLASHNEVLQFLHEAIAALLRRSHRERRRAVRAQPDFLSTLGEAHRTVIDAILSRDPDKAEQTVRKHFDLAEDYRSKQQQGAPRKRRAAAPSRKTEAS